MSAGAEQSAFLEARTPPGTKRQYLAELLKPLRSGGFLSQDALAERAKLATRTIIDIETGAINAPRLVTVMLIAEALDLSAADQERLKGAARKPSAGAAAANDSGAIPHAAPVLGRERDVEQTDETLSCEDVRLVTLAGTAGVGATSLAGAVARAFCLRVADNISPHGSSRMISRSCTEICPRNRGAPQKVLVHHEGRKDHAVVERSFVTIPSTAFGS